MPKIFKRVKAISIHPPRAGRDHVKFSPPHFSCNFNPPAPCGAGPGRRASRRSPTYFNPPAPCGAGLAKDAGYSGSGDFNPPAPCGAGPLCRTPRFSQRNISIHPPHAGRDDFLLGHHIPCLDFIPPAPCGAGRGGRRGRPRSSAISIHPPHAGRDLGHLVRAPNHRLISIHPPHAGRDLQPP